MLAALALGASALTSAPAGAGPAAARPVSGGRIVPLITGDAVVVTKQGGRTVDYFRPARHSGIAGSWSLIRTATATYAFPGAARRYLGSILDPSLFDLGAQSAAAHVPVSVTLASTSARPSVPGLVITSRSGTSASGYLDSAEALRFGDALAAQWRADTAARRVPSSILGGLRHLAPSAVSAPVRPQFPQVTLTLKVIDRHSRPADFAVVSLVNVDDSRKYAGFAFIINGQAKVSVPKGHYSLFTEIDNFSASSFGADLVPISDFAVTGDQQSYVIEASKATVVPSVTTPRTATTTGETFEWDRGTSLGSIGSSTGFSGGDFVVRVAPTEPSPYGTTDWVTTWGLDGTPVSGAPYTYDISFHDSGVVPKDQSRVVPAYRVATVNSRYYSDGNIGTGYVGRGALYPFQFVSFASLLPLNVPVSRTEYIVNDPGAAWSAAYNSPSVRGDIFGGSFVFDGFRVYPAGSSTRAEWLNGALTPGLASTTSGDTGFFCYTCRDDTNMTVVLFPLTDSDPGHVGLTEAFPHFRVWRNGTSLFDGKGYYGADLKVPAGAATYRVVEGVNNGTAGAQLSTYVTTDVSFRSAAGEGAPLPEGGFCDFTDTCLVLPVLTARVPLPTDLTGTVPAGPTTIDFTAGHVQAAQDSALTSVQFQYAIGSGTYRSVPVSMVGTHHYRVVITAPRGSTVSTRVIVNDAVGGHLVQTAANAYRVANS